MELGGGVGERHHDEVWIGFALRCRWAMHDGDDVLVDCTVCFVLLDALTCLVLLRFASFGWRLLCSSWPDFFEDGLVRLGIITIATLVIIQISLVRVLTY